MTVRWSANTLSRTGLSVLIGQKKRDKQVFLLYFKGVGLYSDALSRHVSRKILRRCGAFVDSFQE